MALLLSSTSRLGRLVASDSGVWLERDPDTVREPDIAFFSAEKVPPGVRVTGYSETVPDLMVEVHSPSDSMREVPRQGPYVAELWSASSLGGAPGHAHY